MMDVLQDTSSVLGIGGRLSMPPDDVMIASAFTTELQEQQWLSEGMNWVDIAHVISLIEAGVIKIDVGANLLAALCKLQKNPNDFEPDPRCGDLFTNRELWLEKHSSAVGWLCAGRARRECTTVSYHLTIKNYLLDLADELIALMRVLLMQSSSHMSFVMPDYTYMQPGQPTSFGHYLLSFVFMLIRDLERIRSLYDRVNSCPAGCGGINGSSYHIDRNKLAAMLGFARPVMHTRDAMWQADISIETISTLTLVMVNLDRLSEDLLYFVTREFNYIELEDSFSRASKIMPQKKNPFGLSYIRALANKVIGVQNTVVIMQRTPTGQPDNRLFVYGEIPSILKKSVDGICLLKNIIGGLQFNIENGVNRVKESYSMSTELAESISIENNIDYRTAHKIVGILVRKLSQSNRCLFELTKGDFDEAATQVIGKPITYSDNVYDLLTNPNAALENKRGVGGVSESSVLEMIRHCKSELDSHVKWKSNMRKINQNAEEMLLKHAQNIINQAQ